MIQDQKLWQTMAPLFADGGETIEVELSFSCRESIEPGRTGIIGAFRAEKNANIKMGSHYRLRPFVYGPEMEIAVEDLGEDVAKPDMQRAVFTGWLPDPTSDADIRCVRQREVAPAAVAGF